MLTTSPVYCLILVIVWPGIINSMYKIKLVDLGANLTKLDFHHLENLDLRALSVLNLNCPG